MAAYARTGKYIPGPVAEIGCKMAEVGDRPQVYEQGNLGWHLGLVWQVVKGLFVSRKKVD
jgi:hypothetical protein